MAVAFRAYTDKPGFTPEFMRVHEFLVKLNHPLVSNEGFLWGRWEWMFSLANWGFDVSNLNRIGTWEDNGVMIALATYEQNPGNVWFCLDPQYQYLKEEMLVYAKEKLSNNGKIKALIRDTDSYFQNIAAKQGFRPTQEHEWNSVILIDELVMKYTLPEGYYIVSLADDFDMGKYNKVMWRGFDHEGAVPASSEWLAGIKSEVSGPHVDLNLKIAVAAPNGDFVAYCGMWYLPGTDYALVEPVATDPEYRMKGFGKAAVLEGVKRCGKLGANKAFVGSPQQFYYSIGFHPCSTDTWWECNLK
jgi:GNAT superfamily N-acetyltransferase